MNPAALGLSARDFDAYHPDRASSNAFSRPRLEFKQRALAWARGVTSRLGALGITVDVHGSDEHPSLWNGHRVDCQWVFFWRDAAERADLDTLLDRRRGIADKLRDPSPYFRHAFLALRVDVEGVEVCVQVHPDAWLDFETLDARLSDESRAAALTTAVSQLPDEFSFGVGREVRESTGTATTQSLRAAVQQARAGTETIWVGWRIPRDVAVEHSQLLDEQLEDAIIALASIYRELSWSADDDPAQLRSQLEQMQQEAQRAAAERAAQDELRKAQTDLQRQETTEKSRERTRERVDYAARPGVSLASLFKSDPSAVTPKPPSAAPARPPRPARTGSSEGVDARAQARPQVRDKASAPRSEPRYDQLPTEPARADLRDVELVDDPTAVIDKGTKVRVNAGPFAGKVGLVGEMDGRGGARVLLGLLSTRLAVADLSAVTEAKDRPPLQSSHRRPPIRSGK